MRYVFDKKKQVAKSGTGLLQIEVRQRGANRCVYLSAGFRLRADQFSDMNGFTCRNHPNAQTVTRAVRQLFSDIEAFVLSGKCTDVSDVKRRNEAGEAKTYSFPRFMHDTLSRSNPGMSTLVHHLGLIRKVEDFGKFKTFNFFAMLSDMTEAVAPVSIIPNVS